MILCLETKIGYKLWNNNVYDDDYFNFRFLSVLLDLRDKDIILSKSVEGKTLSVAKTVHITIYMFFITFFFTGPVLLVSLFRQGLVFFIIFLLEIILMDLFIVALTALLYLLILKFFDGEKLKDIINYVQIILSVVITLGYQLMGRLFDFSNIMNIDFVPKWWVYSNIFIYSFNSFSWNSLFCHNN